MPTKKPSEKKKNTCEKNQIKTLKKELNEKNEKLLRTLADLQNIQKRMEKEITTREEDIKKKYLNELIDLTELLEQAQNDKDPKKGLKAILHNITTFLEKEHITCIESIGKPFDHNIHHALCTEETDQHQDNIIINEIKKGYMIHNKLLRPSQVVVAKKKKRGE